MTDAERQAKRRKAQKASQIPPEIRKAVKERSKGRCEIRGPHCTGVATEVHHRVHKGIGGRKGLDKAASDSPANLIHSCGPCHQEVGHGLSIGEGV